MESCHTVNFSISRFKQMLGHIMQTHRLHTMHKERETMKGITSVRNYDMFLKTILQNKLKHVINLHLYLRKIKTYNSCLVC